MLLTFILHPIFLFPVIFFELLSVIGRRLYLLFQHYKLLMSLRIEERMVRPLVEHLKPNKLIKGTVTRFCACAASWFLVWRTVFQDWLLARAIWSILEVLNTIFCIFVQALSRKFHVVEEKCTRAYLLSVFIWLSFLSIKFSTQGCTFFG